LKERGGNKVFFLVPPPAKKGREKKKTRTLSSLLHQKGRGGNKSFCFSPAQRGGNKGTFSSPPDRGEVGRGCRIKQEIKKFQQHIKGTNN